MKLLNWFQYKPEVPKKGRRKFEVVEMTKGVIRPAVDDFIKAADIAKSKITQNRIRLYDHYLQAVNYDTHLIGLIEKRLENIGNKKLVLMLGDEPFEDINYFLEAPKFRKFLTDIILTKFWGMGLFEFAKAEWRGKAWFDYFTIPIKHINPYNKEVLKNQWDEKGVSFEIPQALFVGDPDDLGILQQITLLSIYRRYGMFNYAKYVDLASENFMTLLRREFADNVNIEKVQNQIAERSGGGMISLPDGMDLQQVNQSSTSQNQLFEGYMKMIKEEMAILVLGQTMTTEDGSSRSQAEVHENEQSEKYSSDEQYILDVLNYEFIDYLPLWGFEVSEDARFMFEPTSEREIQKKINNLKKLQELGYVVSEEEFENLKESL